MSIVELSQWHFFVLFGSFRMFYSELLMTCQTHLGLGGLSLQTTAALAPVLCSPTSVLITHSASRTCDNVHPKSWAAASCAQKHKCCELKLSIFLMND